MQPDCSSMVVGVIDREEGGVLCKVGVCHLVGCERFALF